MTTNLQSDYARNTFVNPDKPGTTVDNVFDKYTNDELRQLKFQSRNNAVNIAKLAVDLQDSIVGGYPRISAEQYALRWLDHLISDNSDEVEYYRRRLVEEVGRYNSAFIIYDEETGKPLFRVMGISPTFMTRGIDDHLDETSESLTAVTYNHVYTKDNLPPLAAERRAADVADYALEAMDLKLSAKHYFGALYEIMDFFGRIPPDEEAMYSRIREVRRIHKRYYCWVHPDMSLDDFIEQKGRRLYGFKPAQITPVNSIGTTIAQNTTNKVAFITEDTDDWE